MINVDQNIPMPPRKGKPSGTYPFAQMTPGSSFSVEGYSKEIAKGLMNAAYSFRRSVKKRGGDPMEWKFTVAPWTDEKGDFGPAGSIRTRIWRVVIL